MTLQALVMESLEVFVVMRALKKQYPQLESWNRLKMACLFIVRDEYKGDIDDALLNKLANEKMQRVTLNSPAISVGN